MTNLVPDLHFLCNLIWAHLCKRIILSYVWSPTFDVAWAEALHKQTAEAQHVNHHVAVPREPKDKRSSAWHCHSRPGGVGTWSGYPPTAHVPAWSWSESRGETVTTISSEHSNGAALLDRTPPRRILVGY